MTKITVSYRRRDTDAITGRIFDRLIAHYGADSVFRDIDNIPPGLDFRKHIDQAIASTDILLAIIGPQWAGKTADGNPRIAQENDLVRIEVEAALRKDIPVIPVLVSGATMPEAADLPSSLKDFAFRNAVRVDALEDFDDHVKRLIRSMDRLRQDQLPDKTQPTRQPITKSTGSELAMRLTAILTVIMSGKAFGLSFARFKKIALVCLSLGPAMFVIGAIGAGQMGPNSFVPFFAIAFVGFFMLAIGLLIYIGVIIWWLKRKIM